MNDARVRADADFDADDGDGELWVQFHYCIHGRTWAALDQPLVPLVTDHNLAYFMGYRLGLFSYATKQVGGGIDIDYLSDIFTEPGVAPNQSALHEAIARAHDLNADDYAPNSWAAVCRALDRAECVAEPSTQNQVDTPTRTLLEAMATSLAARRPAP